MLFSQPRVAEFIQQTFEPAWQSVCPVPVVRIDFGNGQVLTRTLHGNIATYVCTPEGMVLDILPGLYDPQTYRDRLEQLVLLHRWAGRHPEGTPAAVATYHRQQAAALAEETPLPKFVRVPDPSKRAVEAAVRLVVRSSEQRGSRPVVQRRSSQPVPDLDSPDELAEWDVLAEDTRTNETRRRLTIHQYLAERELVGPAHLTGWLYREVLNADLDDPYLGLGHLLLGK